MKTKNSYQSALNEQVGVSNPENTNANVVCQIQKIRNDKPNEKALVSGILDANKTDLSRAITLVESTNAKHQEQANAIVQACLPYANNSIRIGITGVPGAGKSTFIDAFGMHLIRLGKKVAVLAVDPSSAISKGSILGDKTRMENLSREENAFIRPSPSGETLGGVSRKTRETIVLCEAAGFDVILIETVGVGQSETAVRSMVDFFLLLQITGAGDGLQAIKRGIIEMADAIVVNKADGENKEKALLAEAELKSALHLFPAKKSGWVPTTAVCSAILNEGILEVWTTIEQFVDFTKSNHSFFENRNEQNQFWLLETINERLKTHFYEDANRKKELKKAIQGVQNETISPFVAANKLLENYFKKTEKGTE